MRFGNGEVIHPLRDFDDLDSLGCAGEAVDVPDLIPHAEIACVNPSFADDPERMLRGGFAHFTIDRCTEKNRPFDRSVFLKGSSLVFTKDFAKSQFVLGIVKKRCFDIAEVWSIEAIHVHHRHKKRALPSQTSFLLDLNASNRLMM